jgi:hypothetical protein
MTIPFPPNLSPLEVGQRGKKELDKRREFSHNTHICPQNPIFQSSHGNVMLPLFQTQMI